MPDVRHTDLGLDPEIVTLARVKPATWKMVIGGVMWLGALSAGVASNKMQIGEVSRSKADAVLVAEQRKADRELVIQNFTEINRRLEAIEAYQLRQTAAAESALALASAMKEQNDRNDRREANKETRR